MSIIIYVLASISIVLAIGGLSAYAKTKSIGMLLSSINSIAFSITAIVLVHWWPIVVGFAINLVLKFLGFDPSARKQQ